MQLRICNRIVIINLIQHFRKLIEIDVQTVLNIGQLRFYNIALAEMVSFVNCQCESLKNSPRLVLLTFKFLTGNKIVICMG